MHTSVFILLTRIDNIENSYKKAKKGETKMPANANTFFIVLAIADRLFTSVLEEYFFIKFNTQLS